MSLPDQSAMAARNLSERGSQGFVQAPGLRHQAVLTPWQMENTNNIQRAQKSIQANLESRDPVLGAKMNVNADIARRRLASNQAALTAFNSALSGGSVTNAGLDNLLRYLPTINSPSVHNSVPGMDAGDRVRQLLRLPIDEWAPR